MGGDEVNVVNDGKVEGGTNEAAVVWRRTSS